MESPITTMFSSCFKFTTVVFEHGKAFKSFFSTAFPAVLPSCFPSTLLKQILCIKQQMQVALNSRSVTGKNQFTCTVDNIDALAWNYSMQDSPAPVVQSNAVLKKHFLGRQGYC